MRILITGGAGFIGSALAESMQRHGHEVFSLDDLSVGRNEDVPPSTSLFVGSVIVRAKVDETLTIVRPDAVVHLAAQVSVLRSMRDPISDATANILGTINVVQGAMAHGVRRIVMASSGGAVYGDSEDVQSEQSSLRPLSAYGLSKATSEQYARMLCSQGETQCIALRMANVFGMFSQQNVHGRLIEKALAIWSKDETVMVNGNGKASRDFIFIDDVVEAFEKAVAVPMEVSYLPLNIATGTSTTIDAVLDVIAAECRSFNMDSSFRREYSGACLGEVSTSKMSNLAAAKILRWHPTVTLRDGIRRLVSTYCHETPHHGTDSVY